MLEYQPEDIYLIDLARPEDGFYPTYSYEMPYPATPELDTLSVDLGMAALFT